MKLVINPIDRERIRPIKGTAKFIGKKQISNFVYELTFEMVEPVEINFQSGQYIVLIVSNSDRRQYSISSAPQNKKQFEMAVDIKPNGKGVNYLMSLNPGDEINLIGQIGLFVLAPALAKNLYFLSTGTGIAPLKSMIEDLINKDQAKDHSIKVVFGTRYINDIFYKEIFNEYLEKGLIKDYKIYLSRPDQEYPGLYEGYITKYIEDLNNEDLENAQFYICGGNEMIKSMEALLLQKGVNEEQIFYEKFY
jgi:ferredoxin-NADP reductase